MQVNIKSNNLYFKILIKIPNRISHILGHKFRDNQFCLFKNRKEWHTVGYVLEKVIKKDIYQIK